MIACLMKLVYRGGGVICPVLAAKCVVLLFLVEVSVGVGEGAAVDCGVGSWTLNRCRAAGGTLSGIYAVYCTTLSESNYSLIPTAWWGLDFTEGRRCAELAIFAD